MTRHVQAMVQEEGQSGRLDIWRRRKTTWRMQVWSTARRARVELDDMHKESIVHPGSLATPVALAFAEAAGGAPGRDVITAGRGYEVGTRSALQQP